MRVTGKEIAEFCDELLKDSGTSIAEMCRITGIKKPVISMWRSHPDVVPKLDTAVAIAEYFQISLSELIGQKQQRFSAEVLKFAELEKSLTKTEINSVLAVARTFFAAHQGEKEGAV